MANFYVYSGAVGTATGADWTNAKTTLAAAATAAAAGDDIWVADDHAESVAASANITFAGTSGVPNRCFCVRRTGGSVPPVAADLRTTATVTTTGATNVVIGGTIYMYGITFNAGSGAVAANINLNNSARNQVYEQCVFKIVGTTGTNAMTLGTVAGTRVEFIDCKFGVAAVGQNIVVNQGSIFIWRSTSGMQALTGATIPTSIFSGAAAIPTVELRGLDLSQLGSGNSIFANAGANAKIINCKLNSLATIMSAAPGQSSAAGIQLLGSGSAGIVERNELLQFGGNLTTETTIVRTGGASDGTTAFSWKLVSNANLKRQQPMQTFEGAIWNAAVGSAKTLTVHIVTDNVTLTDAEAWLEVEYLGSSASPLASFVSDGAASQLATAAAQATSTETWTTTGLTTPVKQKLEVTFTPQMAGLIRWRVRFAKASTTVYVCPKAELS